MDGEMLAITTLVKRFAQSLVHESARSDAVTAARHEAFILSHLGGGAIAVVAAAGNLAWTGAPDAFMTAALVLLSLPAGLGLLLARTGSLETCHLLSAVLLAILVGAVAAVTGGLASFAVVWMIVVPAEAALSGSRRVIVASMVLSCATVVALVILDYRQLLPTLYRFDDVAFVPVLGIASALVYVGGLALGVEELHGLANAAVSRSEERYRQLAENATDLITRHDPEGNVIDISGAACVLLGDDCGSAMGRRFLDFIHLADRPVVLATLTNAARTDKPATVEFRLSRRAGTSGPRRYRWVEMRCRRVKDVADSPEVVAVTRDITVSKEQQLAVLEARDEAERANMAKSHFLAKISHELRTPLNAIIGFSEILRDELAGLKGQERRKGYADLIHNSGSHLLAVVNDLMDMSRLDVGKMEIAPAAFELCETVRICAQVLAPDADHRRVSIELDLPATGVEIEADQRACRQVLINLLSNAIKFTQAKGRVTVGVALEAEMVAIRVEDTGIGIPEEALSRIGNPFYQVENGLDRSHEGAGLGLSVVKGLVELHGGSIVIDSEVGVGTQVTVRLPHRQVQDQGSMAEDPAPLRSIA